MFFYRYFGAFYRLRVYVLVILEAAVNVIKRPIEFAVMIHNYIGGEAVREQEEFAAIAPPLLTYSCKKQVITGVVSIGFAAVSPQVIV